MLSKDEIRLIKEILNKCELENDNEKLLTAKIRKLVERIDLVEQITNLDKEIDNLDKAIEK